MRLIDRIQRLEQPLGPSTIGVILDALAADDGSIASITISTALANALATLPNEEK